MTEFDFLPRSYHEAIRRATNRRNTLLCIGLAMAMAGLHGLNLTRIKSAQAALADLRNGVGSWQSAQARFVALEKEKARCQKRLELISRLDDAVPLDAAIGEATRLMSESMALTGLQVEAGGVEPSGVASPATAPPTETHVRLTGVAATDVEVGIFLGKLSACPLFSNVTLSFSRDTRSAGRKMREFEAKFTLRPVENAP